MGLAADVRCLSARRPGTLRTFPAPFSANIHFARGARLTSPASDAARTRAANMTDREFEDRMTRLRGHWLLPVEWLGDTLIVTPRSDETGYAPTLFSMELKQLTEIAKSGRFNHIIIDLGDSTYFGSKMIGGFTELRQALGDNGRVVFCEPSREMRVMLEKLHIDRLIPTIPTRREAVRQLATVSIRDRLAPFIRRPPWVAAVLLMGAAYWVVAQTHLRSRLLGTPETRNYERVVAIYHRIRDASLGNSSEPWSEVSAATSAIVQPIKNHYERNPDNRPSVRALYWTTTEILIAGSLSAEPDAERLRRVHASLMKAHLELEREVPTQCTLPAGIAPAPSTVSPAAMEITGVAAGTPAATTVISSATAGASHP